MMGAEGATTPVRVLFMQTQPFFTPDARVHRDLLAFAGPDRVEAHVACVSVRGAPPAPAWYGFAEVGGVTMIPVDFGPSLTGYDADGSRSGRLAAVRRVPGLIAELYRLARYARRAGIQVVHGAEKPRDVLYGYLVARSAGAAAVGHLHVKVEDWIRPWVLWLLRRYEAVIGVSDFVAGTAVDMGFDPERVHRVYNAVDSDDWDPTVDVVNSIRDELAIDATVPILVAVGRINPWKGHELLVRSLALVAASGRRFRLLIVGADDPERTPDGRSFVAHLQELVAELELDTYVDFTGPRSDVQSILAEAEVFTLPSWEEPFGLVFGEAMAMAKPIVAIRSGAAAEIVVDGVTGLLAEPNDVEGYADRIGRLLDDPALAARMGAAGRERVVAEYPPERLVDGAVEVWQRAIELRQSRRGWRPR